MDGYTNDTEAMSIASGPDGVIALNASNNNDVNNMTKLIVALTCGECKCLQYLTYARCTVYSVESSVMEKLVKKSI